MISSRMMAICFIGLSVFALQSHGALLCESTPQTQCRPLSSSETAKRDSCEIEKKLNGCDEWFELHPEAALNARRCETLATCPMPTRIKEYAEACSEGVLNSAVDLGVMAIDFVVGKVQMSPEMKARENYFNQCVTADCKNKMLGPYANLFTREEIQGVGIDDDPPANEKKDCVGPKVLANHKCLDPRDPSNQNYLQGLSAKTLYTKLLEKLRTRAKGKSTKDVFIEPWSNEEAARPKSLDELVDGALSKVGIKNSACYDPVISAEMRCYALAIVLDPLAATAASLRIAKLAGISKVAGVERTIKMAETGGASSKIMKAKAEEVGKSINKILGAPTDPVKAAELQKLDKALADDIANSIQNLPPEKQDRLIKLLNDAKYAQPYVKEGLNGMPYLKSNAGGAIAYSKTENPNMVVQVMAKNHPFSRIVVRHEFSHLSRLDAGEVSAAEAFKHADGVINRRLGVYREELKAWGDQYDYTKKVYSKDDLPRLKQLYPPISQADIDLLKAGGALKVEGNTNILDLKIATSDPKLEKAYQNYLTADLNNTFISMVEGAVTKTKSQFTKDAVSQYRKQQETVIRNGKIDSAIRYLGAGVPATGAGGWYLYDQLDKSK